MISVIDNKEDGEIDIIEFVTLMEKQITCVDEADEEFF